MSRSRSADSAPSPGSADRHPRLVRFEPDLWREAGRRWRASHRIIPWSIRWIQGCCALSLLVSVACLASVLMRDPPVLLLSYPDGSIRCAPDRLSLQSAQPIRRPLSERALCHDLSMKFGSN